MFALVYGHAPRRDAVVATLACLCSKAGHDGCTLHANRWRTHALPALRISTPRPSLACGVIVHPCWTLACEESPPTRRSGRDDRRGAEATKVREDVRWWWWQGGWLRKALRLDAKALQIGIRASFPEGTAHTQSSHPSISTFPFPGRPAHSAQQDRRGSLPTGRHARGDSARTNPPSSASDHPLATKHMPRPT